MIPVVWQNYNPDVPNTGYWDMSMLEALFERTIWTPANGYQFAHYTDISQIQADGAIVLLPARHNANHVERLNQDIKALNWVLIILVGDEEQVFPIDKIQHPNMKVWAMTPHMGKTQADRFLINGWSPKTPQILSEFKEEYTAKELNWFFSGQVTHSRREACVQPLRTKDKGLLVETKEFLGGLTRTEYLKNLAKAKVAPCPSGAVIPDSFRLYEALEAGALPIADGMDPKGRSKGYWEYLFGELPPFPTLENWKDLPGTIDYFVDTFPRPQNKVFAWWQKFKREMVYSLESDVKFLSGLTPVPKYADDQITVLIPTSPTASHPDTSMIEETIKTVRDRLPIAEIIIMIDGIREEQAERRANYDEYIRRLLWKCNFEYKNVLPLVFDEHTHQVGMTKKALELVKTPCILFVEHDTPLCEEIPFKGIVDVVVSGYANMVRLHHEALVLDVHKSLMLDSEPQMVGEVPLLRTSQWSQRPHVANTEFYREMLNTNFSPNAKSMIEDGVHGKVAEAYRRRGKVGWNDWKVWMYAPAGDMKRSYHTDGRQHDPKFDDKFIY